MDLAGITGDLDAGKHRKPLLLSFLHDRVNAAVIVMIRHSDGVQAFAFGFGHPLFRGVILVDITPADHRMHMKIAFIPSVSGMF